MRPARDTSTSDRRRDSNRSRSKVHQVVVYLNAGELQMLKRLKVRMFDTQTGVFRKALELLWHSQTKEKSLEEFARRLEETDGELPGQLQIPGKVTK